MITSDKKIGIWGFGITGKAAARFFNQHGNSISILDNRTPSLQEQELLTALNASFTPQEQLISWLDEMDFIVPSAGIDIRSLYEKYRTKWLFELDIFTHYAQNPIIAISGTIGKTTVTTLISQLLTALGYRVITGGNIGRATLDLLAYQENADYFVLEVSDVQLKYVQSFAPDLAILTTFSPNHLDWHDSLEDYFKAKCQLFAHQRIDQRALIPAEQNDAIHTTSAPVSTFYRFCMMPTASALTDFWIENGIIKRRTPKGITDLAPISTLAAITFPYNWLIVTAALDLLGCDLTHLAHAAQNICTPAHRLEKVATINDITFYNDSKATTIPSTLAAVASFPTSPIRLFLGGLSKGVDRKPLITSLRDKRVTIYCFGKERANLHEFCMQADIRSTAHETLESAFAQCMQDAQPGDIVLLSPAGSSFDLFTNYEQRGNRFKELVAQYARNSQKAIMPEIAPLKTA